MDHQPADHSLRKINALFMFLIGLALSYVGGDFAEIAGRFGLPSEVIGLAMFTIAALSLSLMAIGVYRLFRRQPGKPVHWVWWVVPCVIFLFGVVLLILSGTAPDDTRPIPPSPEDLARKIENQAILTEQEFVFESPLGFRLLVPEGFRYLSSPSEPLAFVATNSNNTLRIQVVAFQTTAPLDEVFSDLLTRLRASENTYRIAEISEPAESGNSMASCRFEVERDGTIQSGFLCLKTSGANLFQYQHFSPTDLTPEQLEQLTAVERSFHVGRAKP